MGFLDSEITTVSDTSTLSGVLLTFGQDLQEQLVNSLASEGLQDSNLAQSIRYQVTAVEGGYRFELFFDEYGKFVDEGVSGKGGRKASGGVWRNKASGSPNSFRDKKPPLRDRGGDPTRGIESWANAKGFNKWAVQEAVFRQGIKATHWFTDVIDTGIVQQLVDSLEELGVKQLEIDITEKLKGILNGE
jgi:hypothetical protein